MFRKATQKYKYWKKIDRNTWEHVSGDNLEIVKEQTFRHYYLKCYIAYKNSKKYELIDLGGAMTKGDVLIHAHDFMQETDIPKIDYNKYPYEFLMPRAEYGGV